MGKEISIIASELSVQKASTNMSAWFDVLQRNIRLSVKLSKTTNHITSARIEIGLPIRITLTCVRINYAQDNVLDEMYTRACFQHAQICIYTFKRVVWQLEEIEVRERVRR